MILLEYESAILRNLLERSLDPNEDLSGEYTFCDLDGVRFYVKLSKDKDKKKKKKEDKEKEGEADGEGGSAIREIFVQVFIPCSKEIDEVCDGKDYFDKIYGSIKTDVKSDLKNDRTKYTHAVKFTLFDKSPEEQKKLITIVSRLKANILAIPFLHVASLVKDKSNFAPFEIPYRGSSGESIYITPTEKGAAATYSIRFSR